ncbi:MAG: RecQ family ATP-dependent DNA helicase [Flavobacteriales bacterium]|nr:RecQ family ATP-dependent DNA helicase [Flavobacteriales bacterium]
MAQEHPSRTSLASLRGVLREHWGHPDFRPSQVPVVESAVSGGDTLAILPTGGGKSICYQVPGLVRGGVCLVISPLVALMNDQVAGLRRKGLRAEVLTAGMPKSEAERVLDNARFGPGGFLFVAPERLAQPHFESACRDMDVRTIAIDEAHCASQWGHSFRADYLQLAVLRKWHPRAGWIALTATATEKVAEDIERLLGMNKPTRIRSSMRRPNLAFAVRTVPDRHAALVDWGHRLEGTAILYVRTRRESEAMANMLKAHGIAAAPYHAGMDRKTRDEHQRRWLRGELAVLACTTAFGMGIDKPDVRHVAHAHIPESPEGYIQEAGRAGRDGQPAMAELFLDPHAVGEAEQHLARQWPDQAMVRRTLQALSNQLALAEGAVMEAPEEVWVGPLSMAAKCSIPLTKKSVDLMARAGWIALHPVQQRILCKWRIAPEELQRNAPEYGSDRGVLSALLHAYGSKRTPQWSLDIEAVFAAAGCDMKAGWQHLKRLSELGTIDIAAPADRLSVQFTVARPSSKTARIPAKILEDRVRDAEERWAFMRDYLNVGSCRAQALESLFERDVAPPCGLCDRCQPPPPPKAEDVLNWIGNGMTFAELQQRVPALHREEVRELLEAWRAEGVITWNEGRIVKVQ